MWCWCASASLREMLFHQLVSVPSRETACQFECYHVLPCCVRNPLPVLILLPARSFLVHLLHSPVSSSSTASLFNLVVLLPLHKLFLLTTLPDLTSCDLYMLVVLSKYFSEVPSLQSQTGICWKKYFNKKKIYIYQSLTSHKHSSMKDGLFKYDAIIHWSLLQHCYLTMLLPAKLFHHHPSFQPYLSEFK